MTEPNPCTMTAEQFRARLIDITSSTLAMGYGSGAELVRLAKLPKSSFYRWLLGTSICRWSRREQVLLDVQAACDIIASRNPTDRFGRQMSRSDVLRFTPSSPGTSRGGSEASCVG